jgi:hypothetical protein
MATKDDLIKELQFFSDKLSERSRVIAGGVIATWWALLVGDKVPTKLAPATLVGPVICAAIPILADLLQYAVSYIHSLLALRSLEREKVKEFQFNRRTIVYRTRNVLFVVKLVAALLSIAWLILVVAEQFSYER